MPSRNWPEELKIQFSTGIWITASAFLLYRISIRLSLFVRETYISSTLSRLCIDLIIFQIMEIIVLFFMITKIGKINLENIFLYLPNLKEMAKWFYIGCAFSSYNFALNFCEGFGPQISEFVSIHIIRIIGTSILMPIKEEMIHRGILFSTIRSKYGKIWAYIISTLVFILFHEITFKSIHWGLEFFLLKTITIGLGGVILAYIYESTHKLLLCIIFHISLNIMGACAPLTGFLFGGYIGNIIQ